ncbi:tRNA adenosine(34) deaminase TadA [Thalassotalea maritima]|uniref:tRNA adenosine(34) deaminase TadA n=1 Tax=Thalassotalea maritima TaxID=3242416 RepID=UPI0035294027
MSEIQQANLSTDQYFMAQALLQADKAEQIGEIPVGAVVVCDDKIIAKGFNQSITSHDPSAHAEMIALRAAGKVIENYRMLDCTLYVTLEPCPMCAGLLVHSRIKRVVFGAKDLKTGACGSIFNLAQHQQLNHQVDIEQGILEQQCADKLSNFFKRRRAEKKAKKKALRAQQALEQVNNNK